MPSFPFGLVIVGLVVFVLMLLGAFMLGRRTGSPTNLRRSNPSSQIDRSTLLRQGLRLQATITNIRSASRGTFVTTAAATDLATGEVKTYTQRSTAVLGHRGDPITILVDPSHPNVYLMVRSIG